MMSPVSPEFVRIIHEEKVRNLEREIEFMRIAKERQEAGGISAYGSSRTWYAQAAQWMKENIFSRAFAGRRASRQSEGFEEPCPGVPC